MNIREGKFKELKDYKTILGVLIALNLAVIVGYGSLFYFIEIKEENVSVLLVHVAEKTQKEHELQNIAKVISTSKEEREKIDSYFLRAEETADFIEEIESIGRRAGIAAHFEGINVIQKQGGDAYLEMTLATEGSLPSTIRFLSLLEFLPRALSFEKIFIEQKGSNESAVSWKGSFLIKLLSYQDQALVE